MDKIRLGIIGIGGVGAYYAQTVIGKEHPQFLISAVTARKEEQQQWVKTVLGENVAIYSDPLNMLDSGTIDACMICVPHYFHAKYALACIQRGIHVLMEKPAGVYTKEIRLLNDEAQKHPNIVFAIMYNQRTNHIFRKAKELMESGKYGELRRSIWIATDWFRPQCYFDSGSWRATWAGEGGGVLLNQCAHQMDLWQWICGMPSTVFAKLHYGKWHNIEVEDDATIYVEYPNGATGVFIGSTGDGRGSNRLEIQLDKAQIIVEQNSIQVTEYSQSVDVFSKNCQDPNDTFAWKTVPIETDGLDPEHSGIIDNWAAAIRNGTPLIAEGAEGIRSLSLINAAYLSSWLQKTISLPIDEDLYYEELQKRISQSK